MDRTDPRRTIAALKATVQTLLLEHYWEEDEEKAKQRFLELAEADHPMAMAVVNELSEDELEAAFRWPDKADEPGATGLTRMPVIEFLTDEQRERARVTAVAEDEGDRVRTFVTRELGSSEGGVRWASERIRIAEKQFVAAMAEDLAVRRGAPIASGTKADIREMLFAMPEPWKSRTERELGRLRQELFKISRGGAAGKWTGA